MDVQYSPYQPYLNWDLSYNYPYGALLTRQNAVRRVSREINMPFKTDKLKRRSELWMLEKINSNSVNTDLNNIFIKTLYWKVPDVSKYLTCMASHDSKPYIAIGSGGISQNLFIYELDSYKKNISRTELIHHQTISLPNIHSITWLSNHSNSTYNQNSNASFLATGHKNGIVNLVKIPDIHGDEPAQILNRFHHNPHITPSSISSSSYLNVKPNNLPISSPNWNSCPSSSLTTLYQQHFLLWDCNKSDSPIINKFTQSATHFDPSKLRDGIVAFAGFNGVCLTDIRIKDSPLLFPENGNLPANRVIWSPFNNNKLASIHNDNTIKIWDIRSSAPYLEFSGHEEQINAISWSNENENKLISSDTEGIIRVWNLNEYSQKDNFSLYNNNDSNTENQSDENENENENENDIEINTDCIYDRDYDCIPPPPSLTRSRDSSVSSSSFCSLKVSHTSHSLPLPLTPVIYSSDNSTDSARTRNSITLEYNDNNYYLDTDTDDTDNTENNGKANNLEKPSLGSPFNLSEHGNTNKNSINRERTSPSRNNPRTSYILPEKYNTLKNQHSCFPDEFSWLPKSLQAQQMRRSGLFYSTPFATKLYFEEQTRNNYNQRNSGFISSTVNNFNKRNTLCCDSFDYISSEFRNCPENVSTRMSHNIIDISVQNTCVDAFLTISADNLISLHYTSEVGSNKQEKSTKGNINLLKNSSYVSPKTNIKTNKDSKLLDSRGRSRLKYDKNTS